MSLLALALAGCEAPTPPPIEPTEVSRPAQMQVVSAAELSSDLRFPGRVRAVQRVELAFNVPGQIVELPVAEGEAVKAGALLARLDPAAYQTALDVAQAELDAATAEYERVRRLWERSQAVARAEVDRKRTAMEVARSRFAAAQKDLADTRLTAPFAGIVARRLADNFQNVQAKEPVVSLQNPDALEIVIHVPERVVRGEPRRAAGFAVFDDLPERRLPVTLKSFATEADPQTQTYEVVLGLTPPPDLRVLPGMGVAVLPDTVAALTDGEGEDVADGAAPVLVPVAAVVAAADGTPTVWVVDPESGKVSRRTIETGALQGADVTVLSGLAPGERIVTAGVHSLREGMRVHPLAAER
ncbi:efflux RND transporter periplasmic adaptor subunit [uncultured Thiohalocapsa sp.]|uniref:efflux RND transporter periplasmic adaptor subunit n=1 Tax=uncultured Thiohalocapsa sp. TaxID=768990 RepID=UPI0025FC4299|nr:efflux RND transporter periplasmic adaptor subunit [uncultured Thiohalocapsa sp.]